MRKNIIYLLQKLFSQFCFHYIYLINLITNLYNYPKGMLRKFLISLPIRTKTNPLLTFQQSSFFCSNKIQSQLLQQVEAKVFEVLRSAAKCDQSKLSKSATFQQLGFDSLDSVELVVAMEENTGLDIPNEQAEKISTVEAAINTFYRHLNQKASKAQQ